MIPTPDLSHLRKADYERIYEPAEDTFILLDALEQDAESLRASAPRVCLEIGSGSGCVSTFLGALLGSSGALYLCTDINPHAARCTRLTGSQNKISLDPLIGSLAAPLRHRLTRAVDVLIFNPPYVPTEEDEAAGAQVDAGITGAWAGGARGMLVTDALLEQVETLLSPHGRFYLVAVRQNDIPAIEARMRDRHGLDSAVVLQRRAGGEHLFILRIARRPPV
ncbi:S-adenosyl-L-methionine-dependent methyltransferase [Vararia minispora EC-137]|uniref:S-adenosyl-L-methionine-dependent methyltransferase n=1 Tax=Vararia minispora EC-137 TaxID=1314806 RepID=A0ACB8QKX5_9AGAM|nr:S-adenosyl-L-methionine-dependent methyltransferase [Vararia minispora EC-137]